MKITVIDIKRSGGGFEGSFMGKGDESKGVFHVGGSFMHDRNGVVLTSLNVKGHINGVSMRSVSIPTLLREVDKEAKSMIKRRGWS